MCDFDLKSVGLAKKMRMSNVQVGKFENLKSNPQIERFEILTSTSQSRKTWNKHLKNLHWQNVRF